MQFDSLIINANALLNLDSLETTPNTIIGIRAGIIDLIVQDLDYRQFTTKQLIDLDGKLLTPGLIDCHTHLIYAGNRAAEFKLRLAGASYAEIAAAGGGIKSTVAATNQASSAELLALARVRALSMYQHGVTTLEVKSGYGLNLAAEIKILQVAQELDKELALDIIPTFLGAHTTPAEYATNSDAYLDLIINQMLPEIKRLQLAGSVDAFCEKIGFSTTQTERLFMAATKLGFRVKLHAEQLSNQKGAIMACKYQALSVDHLEYLAAEDVVHLARAGTVAVILPGAFYFLNETKLPPLASLRQAHVPIAIASDFNPGTSPFLALPLIMHMGCVSLGLTMPEVWQGVSQNAAQALGLADKVGRISLGLTADFAIWDSPSPEYIVYSPTENLCRGIIKKGQLDLFESFSRKDQA